MQANFLRKRETSGSQLNETLKSIVDRTVPPSAPKPDDVLDRILEIYNISERLPSMAVASKLCNLKDRTLSAFK